MLLPAFFSTSPMMWVVMSWPVQSCRVSLIGSVESCAKAGDSERAVHRASAPSVALVMQLRENISSLPAHSLACQAGAVFRGNFSRRIPDSFTLVLSAVNEILWLFLVI